MTDQQILNLNAHAIGRADWSPAVIALRGGRPDIVHAALAEVRGFFAVHEALAASNVKYRLTHLPTGTALPARRLSKARLRALAEKLEPLWDWSFTDPGMVESAPDDVAQAAFYG